VKPRVTASFNCRPVGFERCCANKRNDDRIRRRNKFFATAGLFTLDMALRQARPDEERIDRSVVRENRLYGPDVSVAISGPILFGASEHVAFSR
jgi:hypothetical protein